MMLLLAGDVLADGIPRRGADGERGVSFLPLKPGGGHDRALLAPLPGCGFLGDMIPVASLRSAAGYRM